ncbi:MAG: hypothetical protein WA991_13285 [Ornithinimicrobium sp.]
MIETTARAQSRPDAAMAWGRFVLVVVGIYTALRGFSTAVLLWIAHTQQDPVVFSGENPRYFDVAALWDGQWYARIAEEGYPSTLPLTATGQVAQNEWAFYPLFPMAARVVMTVTGWPFAVAGVVLATTLGYAAAVVIAGLLREKVGSAGALGAVALWAAFPAAPVLQVAYTESLALLLLGSVLWLLIRRHWFWAAALALLTGLARPIALPLGLVALVAVVQRWRRRDEAPITGAEAVGMVSSLVACGLSGLMWPALAWARTGQSDAYPATMSAWRGGEAVALFTPTIDVVQLVIGPRLGPWLLAGGVSLLLIAALGPWAAGLGAELRAWTLGYPLYLLAALQPWTSIYRYLLLLFPLFVVFIGAGWAAGDPRGSQPRWLLVVRTMILLLLFLGWQVWWTWELFRFVPPRDNPP